MPTAADYTTGAADWRASADALDDLAQRFAWSLPGETIGNCPIRETLDDALGVTVQNLIDAATEFRALADTCVTRSEICAEFDGDWARYEGWYAAWQRMPEDERGPRPFQPSPPFGWVERSR